MPDQQLPASMADLAVKRSFDLMWTHFMSEVHNDLGEIMSTIVPDANEAGAHVFWSMSAPTDDRGRIKALVLSGTDAVRWIYADLVGNHTVIGGSITLQLAASWWCFHQIVFQYADKAGKRLDTEFIVLVRTDAGPEGISSEIAWDFDRIVAPELAADDRYRLIQTYADALRANNPDAAVAVMADDVQAVVRDYAGGEAPRVINGKDEMRRAFADLFEHARVVDVTPMQWYVGDPRYVPLDRYWTLELVATGETVEARTVEHLAFAPDGRFGARSGWGSPLSRVSSPSLASQGGRP